MSEARGFRFDGDARRLLLSGIDQLADAVAATLGPRGRNVGVQGAGGEVSITSDGYLIARGIEFRDRFLNMGARLAVEAAQGIRERVGDGTTTGLVLLRALVQGGVKNIAAGGSPIVIKRGMDLCAAVVLGRLDAMAVPVDGRVGEIARVGASGNREIGDRIGVCFSRVGKDGLVLIEAGNGTEDSVELVEGMELCRGYVSAHFCTDRERMVVELNGALVFLVEQKIHSVQEILAVLQYASSSGMELLIVADDIDGDVLSTLVMNRWKGNLRVAMIKSPDFGDQRGAILEDLAVLTGACVVGGERGCALRDAGREHLGRAARIVIEKDKTVVMGGGGDAAKLGERVAQLEGEAGRCLKGPDRDKCLRRKAGLQGGVAVIRVGAGMEAEMKRRRRLYEVSLNATRAALEEGVVPGGGVALLRAAMEGCSGLSKEEAVGAAILLRACEAPLRQIVENAGGEPGAVLAEVLERGGSFGFNAELGRVEDLAKAGVLDPVKTVKASLQYAVSTAGVVLMSEALIVP